MGTAVRIDAIAITHNDEVQVFRDGMQLKPVRACYEAGYERPKGTKVLNQSPVATNALSLRPNRPLLDYEWLFAIDTNTRVVGGSRVSVAAVARAELTSVADDAVSLRAAVVALYEMHNVRGDDAERVGWWRLVSHVVTDVKYRAGMSVGIIVDAHLEKLQDINSRTEPFWEDLSLPEGMSALYASADGGKEYAANVLIAMCDREAARHLNYLEAGGGDPEDLQAVVNMPFTHFRLWFNETLVKPNP